MAKECCWAITQMEGRSRCGLSGSSVKEFGFLHDFHLYAQQLDNICTHFLVAPDLSDHNYCVSQEPCSYVPSLCEMWSVS